MNTSLTYRNVMAEATNRRLMLNPADRLSWHRSERLDVYSAAGGEHVVDPNYGNLLVMRDGAVIISGAPTVSAAMAAADCALAMKLV